MHTGNMEKEKTIEENDSFLQRYDTVLSFLGIEIIALVFFGFAGLTGISVLRIFGALIAVMAFPFVQKAYSKQQQKKIWIRLIPVGVLALLLGFSSFWLRYYSGNVVLAILQNLLQIIGFVGFFLLGFCLKNIPSLKGEYVVFGVLCGLALLTLISGVYGLSRYGFFYAKRYSGQVYYFDGVVFPIASETKTLNGFSLVECSMAYGKTSAFLLGASGIGLFWMNPKKNLRNFLILAGFALVGVLDLAFIPLKRVLILLFLVYFAMGMVRLFMLWKGKAANAVALCVWIFLMVCVLALVVLFFADASNDILLNAGIPRISLSLASDTSFFGRIRLAIQDIFYGGYYNRGTTGISFKTLLFGFDLSSGVHLTRCFEINVLYENGLLGFAAYLVVLFLAIRHYYFALRKENENHAIQGVFMGILFAAFIYLTFYSDELPFRHASGFVPVTRSPLIFGLLAIGGYLYSPTFSEKKEATIHA